MTSKINALSTGAGGLATTADASGILEIQTNSTTAMTVSDSQVISINNNFGTVAGLPSYQCRAWVNFNGTGTVAIRGSGNVSSITDFGVGQYGVNFTTSMPDANYAVGNDLIYSAANPNIFTINGFSQTVSAYRISVGYYLGGQVYADLETLTCAIFR